MSRRIKFLLSLLCSSAIMADYLLFTVGIPSFLFHFLWGWYIFYIPLFFVVVSLMFSLGKGVFEYTLIGVSFSAMIGAFVVVSDDLYNFAIKDVDNFACLVINDPYRDSVYVSGEAANILSILSCPESVLGREAFIPTFRRGDYALMDSSGNLYKLILTIGWPNKSMAWVMRVSEDEMRSMPLEKLKLWDR